MRLRWQTLLFLAPIMLAVACSGSGAADSSGAPASDRVDAGVTTEPAEPGSSGPSDTIEEGSGGYEAPGDVSEGLRSIPLSLRADVLARGRPFFVEHVDLAGLAAVKGLETLAGLDSDELSDIAPLVTRPRSVVDGESGFAFEYPATVIPFGGWSEPDDVAAELGFGPYDVAHWTEAGGDFSFLLVGAGAPPVSSEAVPHPTSAVGGIVVLGPNDADGQQDPTTATTLRRAGVNLNVAQSEGQVAISFDTPLVEAWAESGESLWDDPDYNLIGALFDEGFVNVSTAEGDFSATERLATFQDDEADPIRSRVAIEVPFDIVAVGSTLSDGAALSRVVLRTGSPLFLHD